MQTLQKTPQKRTSFTEQLVQRKWYGDKHGQTKVMLITSRQNSIYRKLVLNLKDVDLKLSSNENILGVQIEENLLWNGHFQYISKKIGSSLFMVVVINNIVLISR